MSGKCIRIVPQIFENFSAKILQIIKDYRTVKVSFQDHTLCLVDIL